MATDIYTRSIVGSVRCVQETDTILRTDAFNKWLLKLKDHRGKARIIERIRSAERGNFGDCKPAGHGVSEMRIHFGSGYRLYFTQITRIVYLLLCGGIKRTQQRDIAEAVSYTHLRAHETSLHLVCRLLLEKKKKNTHNQLITSPLQDRAKVNPSEQE
eukprot:TRINITY_DN43877_c0_g1_i1.p2 TRINITY_DN43877_c0_g1~~TRINITY_DN43877_c0_g1_i1.p2  ORF type:complete len:158 (-),score=18.36 TRINITY_DN43877_c0_g1_i1:54-527(-)